jgi:hypothetical protein
MTNSMFSNKNIRKIKKRCMTNSIFFNKNIKKIKNNLIKFVNYE